MISTKITLAPHKSVMDFLAFFRSCSSAMYFDMISWEFFLVCRKGAWMGKAPPAGGQLEEGALRRPTGREAVWIGVGAVGGGWWSPPRWVEGGGRWSPPTSGFASSCLFCTHLAFPLLPRNRRQWIPLSVAKGEESPHCDQGERKP